MISSPVRNGVMIDAVIGNLTVIYKPKKIDDAIAFIKQMNVRKIQIVKEDKGD